MQLNASQLPILANPVSTNDSLANHLRQSQWHNLPHNLTLNPHTSLGSLPAHRFILGPEVPARIIDEAFRQNTDIPGVMIVGPDGLMGVISRRRFFEYLGQLYGAALYLKHPIARMVDSVSREWLLLPSTTTIQDATNRVFDRPERLVYEPLVVEAEDHTYGLLDVRTLLIAQTLVFDNLQRELKFVNDELEARVEDRTAKLAETNNGLQLEIFRRRQIEDELITARDEALTASRLKTELLSHVSHELRTPLGAILGFSELLSQKLYGPLTDKQHESINRIADSSRYLSRLVDDLLDQAQLAAGQFKLSTQDVQLGPLLEDVLSDLRVLAERKGLAFTAKVAPNLPPTLIGDPVRLKQILVNLVSNAIKFTHAGSVHIELYQLSLDKWAMEVVDTGQGIPTEAQSYIFEPFRQVDGSQTRTQRGTGLGLSIVKQLTALMGGEVKIKSAVDQGSQFTIVLPLKSTHSPRKLVQANNHLALVVEDDPYLADIFADSLRSVGYDTTIARDGQMALQILATTTPTLITLDLHLPYISGRELLTYIRREPRLATSRVVLTTADSISAKLVESEADVVLLKPISFNQLRELSSRLRPVDNSPTVKPPLTLGSLSTVNKI